MPQVKGLKELKLPVGSETHPRAGEPAQKDHAVSAAGTPDLFPYKIHLLPDKIRTCP